MLVARQPPAAESAAASGYAGGGMATWRARIHGRRLAAIILVACTITPVFNVLTSERSVRAAVQGLVDGVIIPLLVVGYLQFLRNGRLRLWFRRLGFWTDLALSGSIVLLLFLLGRGLGQVVTRHDPRLIVASLGDAHLLYALPFFVAVAFTLQFALKMNQMIGVNILCYYATGIYHRPTAEERLFLFLDLEGSTQLAERLGSATYFELLRRFVDVRCYFAIHEAIARGAARYTRDFGVVPRFRGGLHGGPVTAGELGDLRQQIVFVGDILNTAARLEAYAKEHALGLVVSGAGRRRHPRPDGAGARLQPRRAQGA
jgi:adenylate cyclase